MPWGRKRKYPCKEFRRRAGDGRGGAGAKSLPALEKGHVALVLQPFRASLDPFGPRALPAAFSF